MGMTTTRGSRAAAALILVLLVACGADGSTNPAAAPKKSSNPPLQEGEPLEPGSLEAPPPVTIRYFDESAELHAWTYCYGNGCADGSPPENPLDIGSPDEVGVEFPLEDWTFGATFTPAGEKCGRDQRVPLQETGDGTFVLRPAGFADTYDVTLFGRGDGDLFVTFRWTTTTDGPLPKPKARLAVLADHDGMVDSYGVELMLENLAQTPRSASATITVEAADGESLTFKGKRARGCWPEGTVYWDGPDDKGLEAAQLGEGPFTYEVEVKLDGERYFARATWPDDEIKGNEPSARLEFRPSLPALGD